MYMNQPNGNNLTMKPSYLRICDKQHILSLQS